MSTTYRSENPALALNQIPWAVRGSRVSALGSDPAGSEAVLCRNAAGTDGALGTSEPGQLDGFGLGPTLAPIGTPVPLFQPTATYKTTTWPKLASNGTNAAWVALRVLNYVYAATLSPAGLLSGTHAVLGTLPETSAINDDLSARVAMAVGGSTAIVAWRYATTTRTRYVIMDSGLGTTLAGLSI